MSGIRVGDIRQELSKYGDDELVAITVLPSGVAVFIAVEKLPCCCVGLCKCEADGSSI